MPDTNSDRLSRALHLTIQDSDWIALEKEAKRRRTNVTVLIRQILGEAVDNLFVKA